MAILPILKENTKNRIYLYIVYVSWLQSFRYYYQVFETIFMKYLIKLKVFKSSDITLEYTCNTTFKARNIYLDIFYDFSRYFRKVYTKKCHVIKKENE